MKEENEQGKLTPGSTKSYDGSGTDMSEKDHEAEDPQEHKAVDDDSSEEEENDSREETGILFKEVNTSKDAVKHENQKVLAQLLHSFFAAAYKENNQEQKEAIVGAIFDLAKSQKKSPKEELEEKGKKSKEQIREEEIENIAEFLFPLATAKKLHPNSSEQEEADTQLADVIYEDLLDYSEKAGFDKEKISEAVAKLEEKQPPVEDQDRFEKLQEYFKDRVESATDESLEALKEGLNSLKGISDAGSNVEKDIVKADSVIDDIINEVEVLRDNSEDKDAQEHDFEKAYAEMLIRVFDEMNAVRQEQEKKAKEAEEYVLTKEEKEEVNLMMKIVLTGGKEKDSTKTSEEIKQDRVSAMLREFIQVEGEGDMIGRNKAVRDEILRLAEEAGLDANAIEINEIAEETDIIQVNDLEEMYKENTFEALIERQIINAEISEVETIRDAWIKLLNTAGPNSDLAQTAKEAIEVLGDIITFRNEQQAAHARGERLDRRKVAVPRLLQEEESKEDEVTTETLADDNDAKEKLVTALLKMFTEANPMDNQAEKLLVERLTRFLIVTEDNYDEQVAKIRKLLLCFPASSKTGPEAVQNAFLISEIQAAAMIHDIVIIDVETQDDQQSKMSEKDRNETLESLFDQSVTDNAAIPLRELQSIWKEQLENSDVKGSLKKYVNDAVEQTEILLPTKTEMSREQAIETEVAQTSQYTEKLSELFVSERDVLQGYESEAVEALVQTVLTPYTLPDGTYEPLVAEQAIGRLLLVFPVQGKDAAWSHRIRTLIIDNAFDRGFNEKVLLRESSNVIPKGQEILILSNKEQLKRIITESLLGESVTPEQLRQLQDVWEQLLSQRAEKKDTFQDFVEQRIGEIDTLVSAKERLTKGELEIAAADAEEKEKPAKEEQEVIVSETDLKINTLENSIAAIENEALQQYLKAFVEKVREKVKEGMTPEEVAAEQRALVQKTLEIKRSITGKGRRNDTLSDLEREQIHALNEAIVPFVTFLREAKDGIAGTEVAEASAEVKEAGGKDPQELKYLSGRIADFGIIDGVDDKPMRSYLDDLKARYESMTPEELEAAIEELNTHAATFADHIRSNAQIRLDAGQKDERSINLTGEELIAFENTVQELRKFLVKESRSGTAEEKQVELTDVQHEKVDKLLQRVNEIQVSDSYDQIQPEKLEAFIKTLTEVLEIQGALSSEQIEAAYRALHLQHSILLNRASKAGKMFEYSMHFNNVKLAEAKLFGELVGIYKEGAPGREKELKDIDTDKVYSYIDKIGHEISSGSRMAFTPVNTAITDNYGRSVGMATLNKDTATQVTTSADVVINRPVVPTSNVDRELQQIGARAKEVFAKEAELDLLRKQFAEKISNGILDNRTEQVVPIRNIPGVQQLFNAIMEQSDALAKLQGYEGLIYQRSDLDPKLYDGYIHEVLDERMRRIKVELGIEPRVNGESYSNEDLFKYYKELQRWAGILISNDVRKRPQDANNPDVLRLSNQRFERFSQIMQRDVEQMTPAEWSRVMIDDIAYMQNVDENTGGNFLRFFKQNLPDPEDPTRELGVKYQRPKDEGSYQPESLQATMKKVAHEFGADYKTGGKHELINAEGEFMYQNFVYWIRRKINEDVDYNKDGDISPFGKIIIKLDMGQISMYELLLLIPQYTSQRTFDIKMQNGRQDEIYSGWGDKVEDPKFKWNELDLIAMEMEFRQMTHTLRKDFTATSISNNKDQYLGLMKKLHHNNHWTRAANIFLLLGYPSASVKNAKEEFDLWKGTDTEEQGSLGKAMSDMIVSYYYLSELTDYYQTEKRDAHGNVIKKKGKIEKRDKTFNENMFYRFLEPDGANRFLIKMAEGSLGHNNDAKMAYSKFIGQRIEAAADSYLRNAGLQLTDDQRGIIEQLKNEWSPDPADKSIDVNFTENSHLENFHTLVQNNILKQNQRNTLRVTGSEEDIKWQVRNELVQHLKAEYFEKLKNMTVKKIAAKQPRRDEKGSSRFLRTDPNQPEIRFGDIRLDGGGTMEELLDSFDIDQILVFDYSNNKDDRHRYSRNPFANITDKDQLREAIDRFMDPNTNPRNYALFKKNEKMMLAFTKNLSRISRKDLNHFRDADELDFSRNLMVRAMGDVFQKTYGIDGEEMTYAQWWMIDYIYLWGIGAALDCDGIGFRWDGKLINTGKWRPRRQGKDGGGNIDTFDEFRAFCLPFLHHMRVMNITKDEPLGHRSIFYWLQGGEGGEITPRAVRKFDKRSHYSFERNAEALYVDNTLDNSSELLDLISKTEFDVTGIISFDVLGNVVFDYAKAREIFGKWRKAARYAYGKNGLDYREKIWVNGREKRLYEHFLGPKTRALNELIYRETGRTIEKMFADPADAVTVSIIAAEVADHRAKFGSGHHWTIHNVLELERFLMDFMTEYDSDDDEYGEQKSKPKWGSLFTHKIFAAGLKAYHTGYAKMYRTELWSTLGSGILKGIGEGIEDFFKGKWIY